MRSSGFDPVSIEVYHRRLNRVTLLVILLFFVLVFRLWYLQIVSGPTYRLKSENNRIHLQDIPPFRGMIFDRHGQLLVDNRPSYDLYLIPEEIQDRERILKRLQTLIGLEPYHVKEKLKKYASRQPFIPAQVKKNLSREDLAVIETNRFNLSGVMIQVKPQRHYIFDNLASHVIGYLGEISESQLKSGRYPDNKPGDFIGKYGVEGRWQKYLNGFRGGEQVEVDAAGRKLRVLSKKPPTPGLNLALTIDKRLQRVTEKMLSDRQGAIVAMNPQNGEIIASASSPAFNPNLFIGGIDRVAWKRMVTSKDYPLQNRCVSGQYPPGSVFKIVVALAGLEEGVIDPHEEIRCTGSFPFGSHVFHCWRKQGHGNVNFHRAVKESCDIYFYKIGRRLGVDRIARYANMCGLGEKTGFDLGFEKSGLIPTRQWKLKRWGIPWQAGETISTSIGQSFVLVTPLQMARLVSAVFNGGRLFQPKVVKWIGKGNEKVYECTPKIVGRIKAKKGNIERIKNVLSAVVNETRGTGGRARLKGVEVAGKTGTAQVVNLQTEKDADMAGEVPEAFKDHAWFVAVAPVHKPQIALSVLVEHGGGGGKTAAPIAREILAAYFGADGS